MGEEAPSALSPATRIELLRTMVVIRAFEDAVAKTAHALWAPTPHFTGASARPTSFRLSAGREPVAAGVCAHLDSADALTAARRPHHLAIAHGMDLRKLASEALRWSVPECVTSADGGHREDAQRWHSFDPDTHFTSSASIAEGYPPALGRAFAFQQQATGRVAVAVTDHLASRQDGFREALDLATLWSLPLVFVVEEDADTSESAIDYGVRTERVRTDAVEQIFRAADVVIRLAREGKGPAVVVVPITPLTDHEEGKLPVFRAEAIGRVGSDPVTTYAAELIADGAVDAVAAARIEAEAGELVAAAIAYARDELGLESDACPTCERKAAT